MEGVARRTPGGAGSARTRVTPRALSERRRRVHAVLALTGTRSATHWQAARLGPAWSLWPESIIVSPWPFLFDYLTMPSGVWRRPQRA